ncbi:MAG TPA: hypothetical protein VGD77_11160 [Gemmatimonadaceae bacterium]
MGNWLRRIRGAVGMGVAWGIAWAIVGIGIGVSSRLLPFLPWDRFFAVYDAPLPTLAIPGFVGGAIFSVVLGIVARRRRFDQLSLPRFAAWGAIGGVLLSLVPAALVSAGLVTLAVGGAGLWELTAMIGVPLTLLSAASAAGSLAIARKGAGELPPGREGAAALPSTPRLRD